MPGPNRDLPPADVPAEQRVLGCVLMVGKIPDELVGLQPRDFYQPSHELIWDTIVRLARSGQPCEAEAVRAHLELSGELDRVGGAAYLIDLLGAAAVLGSVDYYLGIIQDRAARRRMIDASTHVVQEARTSTDPAEAIRARAEATFAGIQMSSADDDVSTLLNIDEFTTQQVIRGDWIVPKLLRRGERLVITGDEGLGKTTLIRQLAMCAAAGMDPFSGHSARPVTVLAVDAENPNDIMIDRWSELRRAVGNHEGAHLEPTRLWIQRRPQGMDLADPIDRRWLHTRLKMVKPDLLVIGPAYKLYVGGSGDREEDLARRVTSALDDLREEFGCALILEHHSPKKATGVKERTVAPIGSSLWLRWPEFGYGIRFNAAQDAVRRRLVDFVPWRGDRDNRPWPSYLESSGYGMPWVETVP